MPQHYTWQQYKTSAILVPLIIGGLTTVFAGIGYVGGLVNERPLQDEFGAAASACVEKKTQGVACTKAEEAALDKIETNTRGKNAAQSGMVLGMAAVAGSLALNAVARRRRGPGSAL